MVSLLLLHTHTHTHAHDAPFMSVRQYVAWNTILGHQCGTSIKGRKDGLFAFVNACCSSSPCPQGCKQGLWQREYVRKDGVSWTRKTNLCNFDTRSTSSGGYTVSSRRDFFFFCRCSFRHLFTQVYLFCVGYSTIESWCLLPQQWRRMDELCDHALVAGQEHIEKFTLTNCFSRALQKKPTWYIPVWWVQSLFSGWDKFNQQLYGKLSHIKLPTIPIWPNRSVFGIISSLQWWSTFGMFGRVCWRSAMRTMSTWGAWLLRWSCSKDGGGTIPLCCICLIRYCSWWSDLQRCT